MISIPLSFMILTISAFYFKLSSPLVSDAIEGNQYLTNVNDNNAERDFMHIVYCSDLADQQLSYLIRSINSIKYYSRNSQYHIKDKIRIHIFYDFNTEETKSTTLDIKDSIFKTHQHEMLIHSDHILIHKITDIYIPPIIKVWGEYSYKLSKKANFVRYYAPDYLYRKYNIDRMLYLDTDTLALNDISTLYYTTSFSNNNNSSFATGFQNKKNCNFGKIIDVTNEHVKYLDINPSSHCITASVMLVDIIKWRINQMTKKIEYWMEINMNHRLYSLGSMPPLMLVAVQEGFTVLNNIIDGKGMKVMNEDELRKDGLAVLIHPAKDVIISGSITDMKNKINNRSSSSTSTAITTTRSSSTSTATIIITTRSSITNTNSSNNSNNDMATLQILVIGPTKCDSIVCIEPQGSNRINLGNYGSALRVLGAEVTFIAANHWYASIPDLKNKKDVEDFVTSNHNPIIKRYDAVLVSSPMLSHEAIDFIRKHVTNVLLLTKPHAMNVHFLQKGIPVFDSLAHFQWFLLHGLSLVPYNNTQLVPVLKLLEVPHKFWSNISAGSVAPIPTHTPYESDTFTAERPARICYHGTFSHILSSHESNVLTSDLCRLTREREHNINIYIVVNRKHKIIMERYLAYNCTAKSLHLLEYHGPDKLFKLLSKCDVGIVPNWLYAPSLANDTEFNPGIRYEFKSSANGGRAFVFAQVGVPVIGHPEFELLEMLAAANIDSRNLVIYHTPHSWYNQINTLLNDHILRKTIGKKLRNYAIKELDILVEAKKLEKIIRKHVKLYT